MKYLALCLFCLSCNGIESESTIPVVSLSKKTGQSTVKFVNEEKWSKKLTPLLTGLNDQVVHVLESSAGEKQAFSSEWDLSRVTVGLKLEAEFEVLDEALEIENEAEIELRFQKI